MWHTWERPSNKFVFGCISINGFLLSGWGVGKPNKINCKSINIFLNRVLTTKQYDVSQKHHKELPLVEISCALSSGFLPFSTYNNYKHKCNHKNKCDQG